MGSHLLSPQSDSCKGTKPIGGGGSGTETAGEESSPCRASSERAVVGQTVHYILLYVIISNSTKCSFASIKFSIHVDYGRSKELSIAALLNATNRMENHS